jgi:hypothetical protein
MDEVGKNPGGFVNGPEAGVPGAIRTEPVSKAVRFDRKKNQYVKLTKLGRYASCIATGFSVECWLKTKNARDHQTLFGTANAPDYITDFLVDIAYGDDEGRLRLYCRDDHSNRFEANFFPKGGNIEIYDDRWHHIVYVCEPAAKAASDRVKLYIDGTRQEVATVLKGAAPKPSAFNAPMTLGAMDLRGVISDPLDGSLDEMAFYSSRLSADQVLRHYRAAGYKEHSKTDDRQASAISQPPSL